MKIERISDTQIRCTLSREDLATRQINLSELAYATDKAKALFRDMIQQANDEFGFDAENLPLMVEAIPIMPDSIVLIITKVEDPEELDTRYSRFSPSNDTPSRTDLLAQMVGADDIIDLFHKLSEAVAPKKAAKDTPSQAASQPDTASDEKSVDILRIFEFYSLNDAIRAAGAMKDRYHGHNTLYRFGKDTCYQLVLHQAGQSPELFNQLCNQLSEYAHGEPFTEANEAYFKEHARCIIPEDALAKLSQLA